jgi:hypothetical protein
MRIKKTAPDFPHGGLFQSMFNREMVGCNKQQANLSSCLYMNFHVIQLRRASLEMDYCQMYFK